MQERAKRSRRSGILRRPGDRWMLRGPIEYVPPATVEVMLRRQAIPLDENEGIYVRDIKTGKVGQRIRQRPFLCCLKNQNETNICVRRRESLTKQKNCGHEKGRRELQLPKCISAKKKKGAYSQS